MDEWTQYCEPTLISSEDFNLLCDQIDDWMTETTLSRYSDQINAIEGLDDEYDI